MLSITESAFAGTPPRPATCNRYMEPPAWMPTPASEPSLVFAPGRESISRAGTTVCIELFDAAAGDGAELSVSVTSTDAQTTANDANNRPRLLACNCKPFELSILTTSSTQIRPANRSFCLRQQGHQFLEISATFANLQL